MHPLRCVCTFTLLAALAQAACPPAHAQAPEPEFVYLEPVRCVGGPFGLKLPDDLRQVRALGKVLREPVAEVERWEGNTASRKTLFFDGLELAVVELSNDKARLFVTHAVVSGAQWNRLSPFKIGQPVAAARQLLGAAAADDPGLKKIYSNEGESVQVESAGGVVTQVVYQCYSG